MVGSRGGGFVIDTATHISRHRGALGRRGDLGVASLGEDVLPPKKWTRRYELREPSGACRVLLRGGVRREVFRDRVASGQQEIGERGAKLVAALKRQMLQGNPLELPRQRANDAQAHRGYAA